jgi:putative ABC transport system permease protein
MRHLEFTIRVAYRNMWRRKSRTLLTISGIALGVAVMLAIDITNESTLASIHRIFEVSSGRAHLVITSDSVVGDLFDESAFNRVNRVTDVSHVAPSVSQKSVLVGDAEEWGTILSATGARNVDDLLIFGVDPVIDQGMRDYELVEGTFLPNNRNAYVTLLVQDYAEDKGLAVGDDLTFLVSAGAESFRIAGLIRKTGPGLQNNGAIAIVPIGAAQSVFGLGSNLSQLDVLAEPLVADSPSRLEALKSVLAETLGPGYQVLYPAARGLVVSKMLASYQVGFGLFSAMALFVAAFLIHSTFTMTVVERTREIGMFRTLGMTRFQIASLVLAEALLAGSLGSAAGVGFGIALSRGLMRFTGAFTYAEVTQVTIPRNSLLASLLVGLVVTLASASLPAWRARNISPLEALRITAKPQRQPLKCYGWLVGLGLIVIAYLALKHVPFRPEVQNPVVTSSTFALLLGATLTVPRIIGGSERLLRPMLTIVYREEGKIGAGNIHRAQGRTALTVAALMVGIAVIIGIQAMTATFKEDLDRWVQTAFGGDLYVRTPVPVCAATSTGDLYTRPPIPLRDELGRRLLTEPSVKAVSPLVCYLVRQVPPSGVLEEADTLLFVGIDPVTYPHTGSFVFEDSQASLSEALAELANGDALLISTTLADRYGLSTGDTLRLETRRGERDFRVAGVVIDFSRYGYVVNGSQSDLKRYFGESITSELIIALNPGYDAEAEAQRLEERYGRNRRIVVEAAADIRKSISDKTAQTFALFDVTGLIGVIIAALTVVNTLMMCVFERQREIGGLRSLGMTRTQVVRMVLAESGALGTIGGLYGVVFGFFLSKVLLLGTEVISGFNMNYSMPPFALGASLVIVLLISQVAALYPAWRASRLRIIEAIQHE